MVHYGCYDCPFGTLAIGYEQDAVISIKLLSGPIPENCPSPVADQAARQLQEYFSGNRKKFDLPISAKGTEFQQQVWQTLLQIPYGETRTYGQIAAMVGKPKATRAVGMACNRNPIWFVIPCHRVVGSNGHLTGYAGGLDVKRTLLSLERPQ